jgi:hypothetical protein
VDEGRELDVVRGRQVHDQVKELEDVANLTSTAAGPLGLAETIDALATQIYLAFCRPIQPTKDMQQRGFPAAAWAHDRCELARAYVQIHSIERDQRRASSVVNLPYACSSYARIEHDMSFRKGVATVAWHALRGAEPNDPKVAGRSARSPAPRQDSNEI